MTAAQGVSACILLAGSIVFGRQASRFDHMNGRAASRVTGDHDIRGLGFAPGEEVQLTREVGDLRSSTTIGVAPNGTFSQALLDEGDATASVIGARCQCAVQYGFGANGRRVE